MARPCGAPSTGTGTQMAASGLKMRLRNWLLGRKTYKFFLRDWLALGDLQRAADVLATMRFSQNLVPTLMPGPKADRITVIAPHPDDEMMGPGGTIIAALDRGADVDVVYLSRGRHGAAGDELCAEAQALADRLGYRTHFLDHPLRNIPVDLPAAQALADLLASLASGALFIPFLLDDHDDHRRASHLLLESMRSKPSLALPEIWGYQVYTTLPGNVAVDITDVASRKAEAIRGFASQMKIRDWPHWALGLNAFNSRFVSGGAEPRYIESFFVVPAQAYRDICAHYFDDAADSVYREENYRS